MSNQHYLHFTLGPVQGFVSQARRTRDFWAGSFLLSWLSAKAIHVVEQAGGKIVMPSVEDDALLKMVRGDRLAQGAKPPKIGSLPNNFIAQVPSDFDGHIAVQAVQHAWKALADTVWKADSLESSGVSRALWAQQISSFWDIAWVIADSDDAAVLAMRKNWRSYMPPESLGDKCTMMGEWQELSGACKPNPSQQKEFWQKLKPFGTMDLQDNERLCAIAYVKRRFVHAWERMDGHKGWKLPQSVPSTSYIAAVHWLEALIEAQPGEEATAAFCKQTTSGERLTRIAAVSSALKGKPDYLQALADVDGRSLFALEDKEEDKAINQKRQEMLNTIPDFSTPLSPFYAILMMDGDSLGETKKRLADAGQPATALSKALGEFTQDIPDIIEAHHGFLIYAGGDDVLAILPLEDALPCAAACRKKYQQVFGDQPATISAAIEYAHMKLPLTMILKDTHKLLDDIAKERTGRDALACRVWKPGGEQQTWSMPWNHALDGDKVIIADLATKLGEDEQGEAGYASKFLYHIRETLEMLQGANDIGHEDMVQLLVADYISSGLLQDEADKKGKAKSLITPLLQQCRVFENKEDSGKLSANAALLLRFLAHKGIER